MAQIAVCSYCEQEVKRNGLTIVYPHNNITHHTCEAHEATVDKQIQDYRASKNLHSQTGRL